MAKIMRVITCSERQQVPSQKAEGGFFYKRVIVLQEVGSKFENEYVVCQFGLETAVPLMPGDLVVGKLHFYANPHNGVYYQDVVIDFLHKL